MSLLVLEQCKIEPLSTSMDSHKVKINIFSLVKCSIFFLLFRQTYIKIHVIDVIWFGKGWQSKILKTQQNLILKQLMQVEVGLLVLWSLAHHPKEFMKSRRKTVP